jgi:hypothetical protein
MLRCVQALQAYRGRLPALAAVSVTAALVVVAVALAATSEPVVLSDAKEDVDGALDLQRASLSLASDGRLRAVVTFVGKVDPKALLAKSGPPGSVCVKIWTAKDADADAMAPDRLVCITARSDDELRASVFEQDDPGLPRRVGTASASLNKSKRSLVVRIAQSALGRPELIRFAIESTRPGCARVSCVDALPDKGAVRRFRIRG